MIGILLFGWRMDYPLHTLHQAGEYSITQGKQFFVELLIRHLISNNTTGSSLNEKTKELLVFLLSGRSPWVMDDVAMTQRAEKLACLGIRIIPRGAIIDNTQGNTPVPSHHTLLLQKKAGKRADKWEFPGGGRREGEPNTQESITQCLARELREECSLSENTINTFVPISTLCIKTPSGLSFFPLYYVLAPLANQYTYSDEHKNLSIHSLSDLFGLGKEAIMKTAQFPFDLTPVSKHLYHMLKALYPHHLHQKHHNSHITR